MTSREYHNLLSSLSKLSRQQKVEMLTELTCQLRSDKGPRRSIMELAGLGRDMADGTDAQGFVNQERDSWNG